MAELKHCPFCGGEAHFLQNVYKLWIVGCNEAECLGCIFPVKMHYLTKEEAIKAWNRRADNESAKVYQR